MQNINQGLIVGTNERKIKPYEELKSDIELNENTPVKIGDQNNTERHEVHADD
jgi:hypothetical protein